LQHYFAEESKLLAKAIQFRFVLPVIDRCIDLICEIADDSGIRLQIFRIAAAQSGGSCSYSARSIVAFILVAKLVRVPVTAINLRLVATDWPPSGAIVKPAYSAAVHLHQP